MPVTPETLHKMRATANRNLDRVEAVQKTAGFDASFEVSGLDIRISCERKHNEKVKAIPARWSPAEQVWIAPASPVAAREIIHLFRGMRCQYDDDFKLLVIASVELEKAQKFKSNDLLPAYPSKTDAWTHQKQAFYFLYQLQAGALLAAMGTGKSKIAVDLVANRMHRHVLIVCPKSVVNVWPREFARHSGAPYEIYKLEGPIKKRAEKIRDTWNPKTKVPQIFVTNYDSAWMEPMASTLLRAPWDLVLLDESHRIKSPGSRVSMFFAKLGRKAVHRLILTGTPMPHSPLDVYAQYRFLDPSVFGTSFNRFKDRYALTGGYGGYEVLGFQRQEELAAKMYQIGFRVTEEVLTDLPEEVPDQVLSFELAPAAKRAYRQMENDMITAIGEGRVTATNVLVKLLRLQQLTSGYLVTDDGRKQAVDTGKIDLLADYLEDLPKTEPVVVFTRFHEDLDRISAWATKDGRRYKELSGRRNDLTNEALMPEDADIFGVQIQSGGVGIDLSRSHYAVYYSLGFSLGDYLQSRARLRRPGQKHPVNYIHLVSDNTVDEQVLASLQNKEDVVGSVLNLYGGLVNAARNA